MTRHVYCDQEKLDGDQTGASWDHAYRTLAAALDGTNVVADDILWVQGDEPTAGTVVLSGVASYTTNPPQVIGVIEGTSNTPPVAADIVPGLRNGSTVAYAQTGGNAPPTLTNASAGEDITLKYAMNIYGLVFIARDNINFVNDNDGDILFEECRFRCGDGESGQFGFGDSSPADKPFTRFKNCKLEAGNSSGQVNAANKVGLFIFEKCIFDLTTTDGFVRHGSSTMIFDSSDFSAQTGAIVDDGGGLNRYGTATFNNCKINASSAKVTGSITQKFRLEFTHTSSDTSKTTGQSFREFNIITDNGDIVEEVSRVRNADDGGSGGWSLAYTPSSTSSTRKNREGLIGPWIHQKIAGDGTSQTLTVFIANNLADDAGNKYDNDQVWLEIFSPEAAEGAADYDYATTQMNLFATPTEVTTETDSTWGSGANNRQKLSKAILPDYTGHLRWRVVFAPETTDILYVDPLGVIS